jgi:hypothetical protein
MKPIVFLGPSLPRAEAERILDVEFRLPIRRGDLGGEFGDRTIVILDGEFGQSFSVSPKEILRLLDRGVRVIGASSMGALRAAELAPDGMEGRGWIYEAYKSGAIDGDDEVALLYSPPDGPALTVPLVNVRAWLQRAQSAGVLDESLKRQALRRARSVFYGDRTPAYLYRVLTEVLGAHTFRRLLKMAGGKITDVKREDALFTLRSLAAECHSGAGRPHARRRRRRSQSCEAGSQRSQPHSFEKGGFLMAKKDSRKSGAAQPSTGVRSGLSELIGRALTDKEYREVLFRDPAAAVSRYKLSKGDLKVLKNLNQETLEAHANALGGATSAITIAVKVSVKF